MSSMPHHPDLDEDDASTAYVRNGRMLGAQPLAPDHQRELSAVLKDHAAQVWGVLRHADKLDSAKATRILAEAMGNLLVSLKTDIQAKTPDRTAEFRETAIKLRAALMKVWGEPKKAVDVSLGSQKTCRICGQLKGFHKPSCEVGIAVEAAKKSGILTN